MNDRAQGGAADLMDSGAIELMQNRRLFDQDDKGNNEALNETDTEGYGIRVNARYHMQIFDTIKGQSLQRQQQISTDNPLSYFFLFDFEEKESP
jgi:hypothetical protein